MEVPIIQNKQIKQNLAILLMSVLSVMLCFSASSLAVTQEWIARYNGPGNSSDYAWAMAMDTSGNVYVTGGSYDSDSVWDYATIKYSPIEDPAEAIEVLIAAVISLNLQHGIANTLDVKQGAALNALDDINPNNDVTAINTLEAFINAVEAQRGDWISETDADALIDTAQQIIDLLTNR